MEKDKIDVAEDFVACDNSEAAMEILAKIDTERLHWSGLCRIARLHHEMGNFEESELIFKKAEGKEKNSCFALNGLGFLYISMERFDEIMKLFTADTFKKLDSTSFLILGIASDSLDDEEKSKFYFREAIRIDDSNVDAMVNLSLLLREEDLEAATFYLEKCLNIDDKYPPVLREIGWNYRLSGDLDKAERFLEEAVKLNPQNKFSYLYLGNLYLAKDDAFKAKENFRKSLDIDPDDEDIRTLVSDFL